MPPFAQSLAGRFIQQRNTSIAPQNRIRPCEQYIAAQLTGRQQQWGFRTDPSRHWVDPNLNPRFRPSDCHFQRRRRALPSTPQAGCPKKEECQRRHIRPRHSQLEWTKDSALTCCTAPSWCWSAPSKFMNPARILLPRTRDTSESSLCIEASRPRKSLDWGVCPLSFSRAHPRTI